MKGASEPRVQPLGRVAALPVRFYRRWISPLKPPTCRFHPTCSAYALEAFELHGVWRGGWLSVWRVLRCQPFCKGGFDPVPDSTKHRALPACELPADVDTPANVSSSVHKDPQIHSRLHR